MGRAEPQCDPLVRRVAVPAEPLDTFAAGTPDATGGERERIGMPTTLLVPLDGSPLAERALPYAARLADATAGRLLLLHVSTMLDARRQQAELDALAAVEAAAESLRAEGVEVEVRIERVLRRTVGQAIADVARDQNAALIVASTHGRGGLGRWLYGSVADDLLRRTSTPLLLVSANCEQPWPTDRPLRILVPLDGSELAESILAPLADLALALRAELRLLQVIDVATYALYPPAAVIPIDPEGDLALAERYLQEIAAALRARGLVVDTTARLDHPASSIATVAREQGCDLIAMATHGRGGLARLVLGSVATGTLQRATVPVLLLRPAALLHPATPSPPPAARPEKPPAGPAITVTLTPGEVALVEQGLEELLSLPGHDRWLAQQAQALLARLKEAQASAAGGRGGPSRVETSQGASAGS